VEPELVDRVYTTLIDGFIEIEHRRRSALNADAAEKR
jgi:hypothetical protein